MFFLPATPTQTACSTGGRGALRDDSSAGRIRGECFHLRSTCHVRPRKAVLSKEESEKEDAGGTSTNWPDKRLSKDHTVF